MRRPSPLPPTGRATPSAPAGDAEVAGGGAATATATATPPDEAVSPVIPLAPASAAEAPEAPESPAERADEPNVGLREVWRAARARRRMLRAEVRRFTVRQRRR